MNAREANVLLTKVALLDPWPKRTDPAHQAAVAAEWAVLLADVSLEAGVWAVREHYKRETRPLLPADVLRLIDERADELAPTVTDEVLRGQRDEWLRGQGIDPVEYDRLVGDGHTPAALLAARGVHLAVES